MDSQGTSKDRHSCLHSRLASSQGDIGEAPVSITDTIKPEVQQLSERNPRGVWYHKDIAQSSGKTHMWDIIVECRL